MKKLRRWRASGIATLFSIVLCVIPILLCCGLVAYELGLWPPTWLIARQYLDAVQREDRQAAIALANSEPICESVVRGDVEKDIAKYGGAEIRNVNTDPETGSSHTYDSPGNSDTVFFVPIQFEYRKTTSQGWERGKIRLEMHNNVPRDSNISPWMRLCGHAP